MPMHAQDEESAAKVPCSAALQEGLGRHFGLDSFRPGQAEVITSILSGKNTIVVMPTGAGKSLCYQLPAMLLQGVTLVVAPLIALMEDQVHAMTARGIPASYINSSLSEFQRQERLHRLRAGQYKLLYVAPERFQSEGFLRALEEVDIALYAIDEAHCISHWGHDFRPDYALLGQVRKRLKPPRTVALTATATPQVRADITRVLLLKEPHVFVAGFDRPNLFLEVSAVQSEAEKRAACTKLCEGGSGIVYCVTRKQADGMYEHLQRQGAPVMRYHAGMEDGRRKQAQEDFMATPGAVAVATNAFGMGIDKKDVRFVAHAGTPRSIDAYYQEVGRAGRDGHAAYAVLLFNHADVFTQERLIRANHPPEALLADIWEALRQASSYDGGISKLARQVGASDFEVAPALRRLERDGAISLQYGGRIAILRPEDDWRQLGLNLSQLQAVEAAQLLLLKRMAAYAYTKRCRRAFMLSYFGEAVPFSKRCGTCDVCCGPRLPKSQRPGFGRKRETGQRMKAAKRPKK